MEIRQVTLKSLNDTALAPLVAIEPNLVLAFGAPRFFEDGGIAPWLGAAFGKASRVGVSTAGEISSAGADEDGLVLTAIRFDRGHFVVAATDLADMADCRGAGQRLASQLVGAHPKAAIVFSQGVGVNGSDVIKGLVEILGKDVPLTGGLAGDYGAFTRTWVLHDDRVSDHLMVAIGFHGDVTFAHGSFGGWQSFGPVRRATRAVGNILYELDGQPALGIYQRYLGDYAKDLPASGLLFPIALLADDQQESGLIRTLLGVNEADGALILAGDVPQDSYMRLMHASTEALVGGAEDAAKAAKAMHDKPHGPALGLLVSCVGRRLAMGDRVDEEVEAVGAVFGQTCVLAGFYSNGEISPYLDTTECKLHNQTMTITVLSEPAAT